MPTKSEYLVQIEQRADEILGSSRLHILVTLSNITYPEDYDTVNWQDVIAELKCLVDEGKTANPQDLLDQMQDVLALVSQVAERMRSAPHFYEFVSIGETAEYMARYALRKLGLMRIDSDDDLAAILAADPKAADIDWTLRVHITTQDALGAIGILAAAGSLDISAFLDQPESLAALLYDLGETVAQKSFCLLDGRLIEPTAATGDTGLRLALTSWLIQQALEVTGNLYPQILSRRPREGTQEKLLNALASLLEATAYPDVLEVGGEPLEEARRRARRLVAEQTG